jgi:hypothetical protein
MTQGSPAEHRLEAAVSAMMDRLLEAERLASGSIPKGPYELDSLDRVLPALHRRVRRSALAVHLLLSAAHPFEAAIVGRSLFEDSIKIGALRIAGTQRARLILGWMSESTSHGERMLREGSRARGTDLDEVLEAVKVRRRYLASEASRLGIVGKLKTFPDERQTAESLGRLDEYYAYLFASQITHGAETAYIFDPDPVGDATDTLAVSSTQVAGAALTLSVTPLLRAHIDVAEMLGWPGAVDAQILLHSPLAGT